MSKKSDDYEAAADAVRAVAKENAGKVIAVYLNTEDAMAGQVLQYLSLKEGDYPAYRLLNLEKVRNMILLSQLTCMCVTYMCVCDLHVCVTYMCV